MEVTENWDTIPKLIRRNYQRLGSLTAMCMKRFGIWQRYSWQDYYHRVKYLSLGLVSLGLKPGDVVCIIGDNEPEWFWGEFAVQAAGGIATGIFVDSTPAEVKYIVAHSGARFAIVNDQEQTDKFLEIRDELPSLERIIYWNPKGLKNYDNPILTSFTEVMKMGRLYEKTAPGSFEQRVTAQTGDDIAFIYYTSGTTDLPKGAKFTHGALLNSARKFIRRYPMNERDELVSNFPAAWVGDSFFATLPHLLSGARLNFPEKPETIAEDTREVGPTLVTYGPRQWESLVSDIQAKMIYASSLRRFIYSLFLPVGHKITDAELQGEDLSLFSRVVHQIAYLVLFRALKERLGLSRVRFAVTGGSVLSPDTLRLIHAIGVELRQNYVTTEAGFIASHGSGEVKLESVGRPALGTEVRISDAGELLVRSDSMFSGYHKDPDKTAAVLAAGWYHTGDAVNIDEDGHLVYLDRLEHVGELSSGVKYAPQYIESQLRFSPYIKNAIVIGGRDREFVSAIINVDFAVLTKWAEHHGVTYTTFADLSQKAAVADLVREDLLRVNSYLTEPARVRKFVLLHKEFDPDEAELTRTRKLRRAFIEERYRDLISTIYRGGEEMQVKVPVTYRDGRKGVLGMAIKVRGVSDGVMRHGGA
ncbi:MAG: AMP-binding protein [Dehalococcoidia bacterium]